MVGAGSTFVAIEGKKESGTAYIPLAIERGAARIILQKNVCIEPKIILCIQESGVQCEYVENSRETLATLSAQAFNYPADKLCLIGITGTKGKTTTAWLTWHLLHAQGYKVALISTVHNKIGAVQLPSVGLTTPHPDYLHTFFATCVQQGITHVVIEVAAQALSLHRLDTINFDLILLTNFSHEHSEFYASQGDYLRAKEQLFVHRKPGALALICTDTPEFEQFKDRYPNCLTVSSSDKNADYYWRLTHSAQNGLNGTLAVKNTNTYQLNAPLLGAFNGINSACALALVDQLNGLAVKSFNDSLNALTKFTGVPGRAEFFTLSNGALCCIDYAHNPASIQSILTALKPLSRKLIVVFGAGGERDALKRPLMARFAMQLADIVILTSDNPRSENPADIIAQMRAGVIDEESGQLLTEIDRAKALQLARSLSSAGDLIALLGKGPDHYQLINGVKYPFNEREIINSSTLCDPS